MQRLGKVYSPGVVAWKEAWKEEHGTPEAPKDNVGARIDIDEAIVYVPINEGCPVEGNFFKAWKSYYEVIKTADPNAKIAGSNDSEYGWGAQSGDFKDYIQFCADNNCVPDVVTWHELGMTDLNDISWHVSDARSKWEATDWSK